MGRVPAEKPIVPVPGKVRRQQRFSYSGPGRLPFCWVECQRTGALDVRESKNCKGLDI